MIQGNHSESFKCVLCSEKHKGQVLLSAKNTEGYLGLKSDTYLENLDGQDWLATWNQHHLELPELVREAAVFVCKLYGVQRDPRNRGEGGLPTYDKGI